MSFLDYPSAYFKVGSFDNETDTWPVYHYVGNHCSGTVAEFLTKELADEWVKWKHETRQP